MLKSILIGLLMFYILFGSFSTAPKMIQQQSNIILSALFVSMSVALYFDETIIALLCVIVAIVYLYSIDKQSLQTKINPQKGISQKKNQILKKEPLVNEEKGVKTTIEEEPVNPKEPKDPTTDSKKFHGNLKTQSNIFNKLNSDLYYNELGEQFNIQGFDDDVKGFDQSIYN